MIKKLWKCLLADYYNFKIKLILKKRKNYFNKYIEYDREFEKELKEFEKLLESW